MISLISKFQVQNNSLNPQNKMSAPKFTSNCLESQPARDTCTFTGSSISEIKNAQKALKEIFNNAEMKKVNWGKYRLEDNPVGTYTLSQYAFNKNELEQAGSLLKRTILKTVLKGTKNLEEQDYRLLANSFIDLGWLFKEKGLPDQAKLMKEFSSKIVNSFDKENSGLNIERIKLEGLKTE